ncbi:MAG: hypothetical protein AB7E42_08725 [Anaerotignaceae bacterium]
MHKLKLLPSQFLGLSRREKAFVIAAIDIKVANEKKELARNKKK